MKRDKLFGWGAALPGPFVVRAGRLECKEGQARRRSVAQRGGRGGRRRRPLGQLIMLRAGSGWGDRYVPRAQCLLAFGWAPLGWRGWAESVYDGLERQRWAEPSWGRRPGEQEGALGGWCRCCLREGKRWRDWGK